MKHLLTALVALTLFTSCNKNKEATNEPAKEETVDCVAKNDKEITDYIAKNKLKAQKSDPDNKLENVERTILTLLDEKYTSTDPNFKKAIVTDFNGPSDDIKLPARFLELTSTSIDGVLRRMLGK